MLEKWKKKSNFGKTSDVLFILFILVFISPMGRQKATNLLAKLSNPSQIDGAVLQMEDYNWQLKSLNGDQINLQDFKNKVIFINEWATWCPPCVAEMPEIQKLHNKFEEHPDIKFLMISNEEIPKIKKFIDRKNYTFPVYVAYSNAPPPFQSKSIPTSFLVSKKGKIVIKKTGPANWGGSKMESIVNELLNQ